MKCSTTPTIRRAILGSDIIYLAVRERFQKRVASIKHIENKLRLAMTKCLPRKFL